jgi:hypothetical protein
MKTVLKALAIMSIMLMVFGGVASAAYYSGGTWNSFEIFKAPDYVYQSYNPTTGFRSVYAYFDNSWYTWYHGFVSPFGY